MDEERVPNLGESLEQCLTAFELLSRNQFNKALKICDKWSKHSLYHMHIKSLFHFLKAILTLEKPEIDKATKLCEEAQAFCDRIRRSGTINALSKFITKPCYNSYSEDEVHAELIYAEQQLMIALITFFGDQSIVSLVKGALRIRSCNSSYKECMTILESRDDWESDATRMHFESGTRLGIGALNLVLSHLPQRVLKLLEFMGFSGSKEIGLDQLNRTADNENGLRHFLAELLVSAYECYMEQIFGLGRGNLTRVQQIVDRELIKFDKSAWFLWFKARILQMKGDVESAIPVLEECLTVQSELRQLHNICFWELLWCHAVKCEWDSAAKYASILGRQCHWSPATFAYQEATFLYMKMIEEEKYEMRANVINLLKSVPTLRIRYAGKTIPPEKYCCVRAEKYSDRSDLMILPAFELFYIWNIFSLVSNNQNLIKPMIRRIDKYLDKYESKDDRILKECGLESQLMLLFMKGVCLKELGQFSEAQLFFERILKVENQIRDDTFLPPEAALELGLCKLAMGCHKQAKHWLEKARKDYTGYQLETIIHFRVHCALQVIKKNNRLIA